MNPLSAITFIFLAIFGALFMWLTSDVALAKATSPAITLVIFGCYIAAATGILLGVSGAVGFSLKRNTNFWAGFQPINVGLILGVWSAGRILEGFSWMYIAGIALVSVLLLSFVWRHIVAWRFIPLVLILFDLSTIDVKALHFLHFVTAVVLVMLPTGLLLKRQFRSSAEGGK